MRKCQAVILSVDESGQCPEVADHAVTFSDGDKALVCQGCALRLRETARDLKTEIAVERIQ